MRHHQATSAISKPSFSFHLFFSFYHTLSSKPIHHNSNQTNHKALSSTLSASEHNAAAAFSSHQQPRSGHVLLFGSLIPPYRAKGSLFIRLRISISSFIIRIIEYEQQRLLDGRTIQFFEAWWCCCCQRRRPKYRHRWVQQ